MLKKNCFSRCNKRHEPRMVNSIHDFSHRARVMLAYRYASEGKRLAEKSVSNLAECVRYRDTLSL
ncbi:hypothetical protein PUN28_008031 [Cardiocondyla obscurior]|uniref:Tyr recombinase domain-containing protein n=1 Tax=Cardiocondyla obscurior TaxID=286306 RepID=A0AAW2FZ68_9HYME